MKRKIKYNFKAIFMVQMILKFLVCLLIHSGKIYFFGWEIIRQKLVKLKKILKFI